MRVGFLCKWAERIIASRPPDFVVGTSENPYMLRWYAIPRNKLFNIYIHEFKRSDDPRALHDHPWVNMSLLLDGAYNELTIAAGGIHHRKRYEAGYTRFRLPTTAHRVELIEGVRAMTLFITGPVVREWGFHCRLGWRSFKDFVRITYKEGQKVSSIGEGCGELN